MTIGYVITSIKKSGNREMTFSNNKHSTYTDRSACEQHLKDVLENNNANNIEELCGKDLQVTETTLYPGGDSTKVVFG